MESNPHLHGEENAPEQQPESNTPQAESQSASTESAPEAAFGSSEEVTAHVAAGTDDVPHDQPAAETEVPAPESQAESTPEPVATPADEAPVIVLAAPQEEESIDVAALAESTEQEEVEAEPQEDFGQMSKEDLLARMEAFSREEDVNAVKNRVQAAREVFQQILNQERDAALAAFLEKGGVREEFEYKDALEEKFFNAFKHFQKRRSDFVLGQEKIRSENLRLKNEILQQMKNIIQNEEDLSKVFNEFHDLQAKWRAIGPVPPKHVNDLWMTYKLYSDNFFEFIKLNRELQDLEMKKNLEMKMQLCERAEEMLLEPSLNKALQEIQGLQLKWKEVGSVPREKRTEIWVRFKAAVDKIYDNKRSYLDSQKQVFEGNYKAKLELIEKVEALLKEGFERHNAWQEGLQRLLNLQAEWRKIGPAGKEHNDEVWTRFKGSCDQFFRNKDNFYKQKKQEYAANLQKKTELCIQAEALQESSDWKSTANELIRLQQEWKGVGPAGDKNEKVWQRFKTACDSFFQRKSAHFADQDQVQEQNLIQKNALITEVEQFSLPGDPSEAIEQLKSFQRRFTEIGLVPHKNKDDIQQRFRNAIQVHFDALKSTPEYRQSARERSPRTEFRDRPDRGQRGGFDRAPRPGAAPVENEEQRNLMSKISKLSGEVQVWENNLGFFANSKNASALRQEYEARIQQAREEIDKIKSRLQELRNVG